MTNIDLLEVIDHMLTQCDFNLFIKKAVRKSVVLGDFSHLNCTSFETNCPGVYWDHVQELSTVGDKTEFFNNPLIKLFDAHAPQKQFLTRNKQPSYVTENIKLINELKIDAYSKHFHSRSTSHLLEYYKQLKNFLSTAVKNVKNPYINPISD